MNLHAPAESRFRKQPTTVVRMIFLMAMLLVVPLLIPAVQAYAATPAESFVATNIQKGLQILNNKSVPFAQRGQQFRELLTSLTDARRIGTFTLGPVARTAPKADVDAFVDAFHEFAVAVYQSQLSRYSGQTLKVTSSVQRRPGDYIVNTVMMDPGSQDQPLEVAFRVSDAGGHFVVLDVSVAGIWLAITERDQFTAFLNEHNNSVPALVTHLKQLTQQMHNGAAPPTARGGSEGGQ